MIPVKLESRILGVAFTHPVQNEALELEVSPGVKKVLDVIKVRHTQCDLHVLVENEDGKLRPSAPTPFSRSYARCGLQDNFNKEQGRKISLRRALANSGLTREERTRVWDAYLSRFETPSTAEPEAAS